MSSLPTPNDGRAKSAPHVVGFALFIVGLIAAFGRQLHLLITNVLADDLRSYVVLIPFVSAYFLYIERGRLARHYERSVSGVLVPLIAAVSILIFLARSNAAGTLSANDRVSLVTLAFVCLLWSGGFLFLGRSWMASAAFPMFFLIFLVPLPDEIVYWFELGLRLASAEAANLLFAVTGTPTHRTGTVFELPGITIEVAPECSGIRSSWILFITSIIAAKLLLTRNWARSVLVAAVIPLGILRNGFRIMVIGLLCVHLDPDWINSRLHHKGGPIFFVLSLGVLLVLLWFLKRREAPYSNAALAAQPEA